MSGTIDDVLNRLKEAMNIDRDANLAEAIGVSRQVLSTWRKRGTVPYEKLCEVAREKRLSLDWLLLGRAPLPSDDNELAELLADYREVTAAFVRASEAGRPARTVLMDLEVLWPRKRRLRVAIDLPEEEGSGFLLR
jgi:transcriptional regulator with XRE-family HTH domain